jgi:TolB-like protein
MTLNGSTPSDGPLHFSGFVFDRSRAELRDATGTVLPLRPKTCALLEFLLSRQGRLVSRDAILDAVWTGVTVSQESVDQAVGELRRALGPHGAKLIRTVPRRGYLLDVQPATLSPSGAVLAPPHDRPTIAVLPFANMSGDPEQEHFADGVVEEIIAALSRIRSFFVISRSSTFTYKGKAVDPRQVSRELGVRYVLEGSVRRAGDRLRIATQLVDATTGTHVWNGRHDGEMAEIFDLQDRITEAVVGSIEPSLRSAEIERSRRKRPEELGAYDLYLHALPLAFASGEESVGRALKLLQQAIRVDPTHAYAHALAGWCYVWRRANAWARDEMQDERGVEHAEFALSLAPSDPEVLWIAASVYAYIARDLSKASDLIGWSLSLNPNSALAWTKNGWVHCWIGNHTPALDSFLKAKSLSPLDPLTWYFDAGVGSALTNMRHYSEALDALGRALRANPEWNAGYRSIAVCAGHLGATEEARRAVGRILRSDPTMTVAKWRRLCPIKDPETLEHFLTGLILAGLPEG